MLIRHYRLLPLYFAALLIIPLIIWCFRLLKGNGTTHYYKASSQLKIIMLLGICSLVIYHLEFN
jgi:hypothetical protein